VAEVDRVCSVHILIDKVVVDWRSDGGVGGELAVNGNLRSIASLSDLGRGVGLIGAHC